MLKNTKIHKDKNDNNKYTIKVGNKVPKNGLSLAFYHNKGANSHENVLASSAPKNLTDHMEIFKYQRKDNLTFKNDEVFDDNMPYEDEEGYIGSLRLEKIDWNEHIETETKFISTTRSYNNITEQKVPETIFFQEGKLKGTLYLKQAKYTPTKYGERVVNKNESKSFIKTYTVENLEEAKHTFPLTYKINEQGYVGEIPIMNGSERFTPVEEESKVVPVVLQETLLGIVNNVPTTKTYTYRGKKYNIPLTSRTSSNKEVKHYGVCRYWGHGATGLYGKADRKYKASKDGGKGYFKNNKAPAQLMNRYGHKIESIMKFNKCTIKSSYTGWKEITVDEFYIDETVTKVKGKAYSGKYNHSYNYETCYHPSGITPDMVDGSEWTYDIEKAAQYGAPNNLAHGGCVWASQYANVTKEFPPKGYENDPIHNGSNHMWLVTDTMVIQGDKKLTSGTIKVEGVNVKVSDLLKINKREKLISSSVVKRNFLFTNVTKTTKELAYPGTQQFSKMTIQFYKGKTQKTDIVYSGNIIVDGGTSYTGKADYKGTITKNSTTIETVPIEWNCEAVYEGVITYSYPLYDGLATYRGVVVKRNAVGNLSPEGEKEFLMYPDDKGILHIDLDNADSSLHDGTNFMITNVFYDDTPLYYSHMLKLLIYDTSGPDELGYYKGNTIKLVDENNKDLDSRYKYKIKLIPTNHKHLYRCYVFTSFKTITNKNIYIIYNGYKSESDLINPSNSDFEALRKEKIYVQPHMQVNKDFNIINVGDNNQSNIKVNDFVITKDLRRKIPVCYVVKTTDNHYVSKPIYANILNNEYSFNTESSDFYEGNHIISPKEKNVFLTATDILVRDLDISPHQLSDKQITVEFYETEVSYLNYNKVYLYTDQDGSGLILAKTSYETGFYNNDTDEYDLKYNFNTKHIVRDNYIHCAYSVFFKDVKSIEVLNPIENKSLENWYPRISFGHFVQYLEQYNARTKITYSIPEYNRQNFNTFDGKPYKNIQDEKAIIIDNNKIKIRCTPMYVKRNSKYELENLNVYKINILNQYVPLEVNSWSYEEGIIELVEDISENDNIFVNYSYEEETYVYRGHTENGIFVDIDLNPNMYHTYLDNSTIPYTRKKTYNLFDTIVYFFIRPKRVEDLELDKVFIDNTEVLYHKIGSAVPDDEYDLLIGKVYVRHNTSLKSTEIIDTRQRGGGILEEITDKLRKELEPESDFYLDIGYYDGEMYTENSVVIIRLDNRILKEYGGIFTNAQVEEAINKWISFGTYYIVEYVKVLEDCEIPQYNLTID